ncbi:energy-coupling factor transporter transmembrane component T [Intestinibacter sp.]
MNIIFSFEQLSPVVISIYFVTAISMLYYINNPVIIFIFLLVSLLVNYKFCKNSFKTFIKGFIMMAVMILIINPLVSHKGTTILFYIGYTPITLESIFYGLISAMKLMTLLLISNYFNKVMTYEKLIYILSPLGHNLSLIISLSVKFIPEYLDKITSIKNTQRTKGIRLDSKNKKEVAKSLTYILNSFFFITLEDGIITIKSIKSRGYYNRDKKNRMKIRLKSIDYMSLTLIILTLICTVVFNNQITYEVYPTLAKLSFDIRFIIATIVYTLFLATPILLHQGEKLYVNYQIKQREFFISTDRE